MFHFAKQEVEEYLFMESMQPRTGMMEGLNDLRLGFIFTKIIYGLGSKLLTICA